MKRIVSLASCLIGLAGAAQAAGVNRDALYKHLQKTFNTPPGVEFELKDVKPSPIEGFLSGVLESRFRGNSQSQGVLLSSDGKYYILSEVYQLAPSKIGDLLGPVSLADGEAAPQVHVSKDMKHFVLGEPRDMTVDPDATTMSKISFKGHPARGPENAPITIVEFSDMQCPYCKNAHMALEEKLVATYGDKVRWVFKHFPLTNIHPWAYPAALAATCVAKQKPDASWKFESAIFNDQEKITPANFREKAVEIAGKAGVKTAAFETCFDKQETKPQVEADIKEARELKVGSTPTFIVNGRTMQGFRDFDTLKALIDQMLDEKKPERE